MLYTPGGLYGLIQSLKDWESDESLAYNSQRLKDWESDKIWPTLVRQAIETWKIVIDHYIDFPIVIFLLYTKLRKGNM